MRKGRDEMTKTNNPYKRKPILLHKNAVMWIQIFTKTDDIEDVMFGVWEQYSTQKACKEAAKEFIRQLREQYNIAFIEALRQECEKIIARYI